MLNGKRRVVVTGIGAITPLGASISETWAALLQGRSGVSAITRFDTTDSPVRIAGEVKSFDPTHQVGPFSPREGYTITQGANAKDARKMGRYAQLAVEAGLQAYADSGLDAVRKQLPSDRIAVNIGCGMGGLPEIEDVHSDLLTKGYRRVTPFFITQVIPNLASGYLSILLDIRGPSLCTVTACASSAHSIGESFRQIQRGDADIAFTGGAEAVIGKLAIAGFAAMRALSTRNEEPTHASRPFDKDRDGFVMSEGGAVLVLEEYEMARKRGANIYAEVVGYGASSDCHHITLPSPDGEGGARAMTLAVRDAGLNWDEIGYVNAHGTSTPAGDAEEARAIARVFGNACSHLHVSSTKSMTGHLLGAAGSTEAIFSILAMRDGRIPPTINLNNLDPACVETRLCFTPNHTVEKELNYALSNSFGFGGTNASLVFKKSPTLSS